MKTNIFELVSFIASVIGVSIAVGSLYYYLLQKKKSLGIRTVSERREVNNEFINLIKKDVTKNLMVAGVSLRGLLINRELLIEKITTHKSLRMRFLILNPYSLSAFKYCQQEEKMAMPSGYLKSHLLKDINTTVAELKKLSQNEEQVQVRFYNEFPIGSIVITDSHCLFSPYSFPISRGVGSASPTILISKNNSESSSFYHNLVDSFENVWSNSISLNEGLQEKSLIELSSFAEEIIKTISTDNTVKDNIQNGFKSSS